ncbi:MAG: hypothetical protein WC737_05565 [Parcubacteria group bacterium]|jgi:hypothetical protein
MEKHLEQLKEKIIELLKDYPADVNTAVLLSALIDLLTPIYQSMSASDDVNNQRVTGEIRLIIKMAQAIMELLDTKEVKV